MIRLTALAASGAALVATLLLCRLRRRLRAPEARRCRRQERRVQDHAHLQRQRLKAGTYTVVIHDGSKMHNYELDGPNGKSWTFTTVHFAGTKTFTLKLVPGKYKAYCVAHESTMFHHFTVT